MHIGFLIRTGPYTSQNIDTFYEMAKSLLKKGHKVSTFLYEDGVINIDKDIKSPQERNIKDRMVELAGMGVTFRVCGTCAKFRGQTKDDIVPETKHGGMAVLVEFINTTDRFISLGF